MHIKQTHMSTLQQNLLKEHVSLMYWMTVIIKHENTTRNIRKPGGVGKFKFSTLTQNCNGLISWSFEIPAYAYCQTLCVKKLQA